mmetsp:Transcript_29873/g.45525  ORF Transcript_29873/g.45525 Transcript_29873/m.45525 type:complete len:158 (-) Transcript_29873:231-704(-)
MKYTILHETTNLGSPIRHGKQVSFSLPTKSPLAEELDSNSSKRRMLAKKIMKNQPIERLEKQLERCKMQLLETTFENEVTQNDMIELIIENKKLESRIERRKRRNVKLEASLEKMQKRFEKYSKKIHDLKQDITFYSTKSAQMMQDLQDSTQKKSAT